MELKNIPAQIVSGRNAKWTITLEDFSPDEWTLSYHVRGAAAANVVATASSEVPGAFDVDFKAVSLVVLVETPLPPGQYFWQSYATNVSTPSDKRLVGSGRVEILTDLSVVSTFDGRTKNEITWLAIKAMLAKKATRDQESYTIGQRTIKRIPFDQLIEFERYYAKLVAAERRAARAANGESFFENIYTEFGEPR